MLVAHEERRRNMDTEIFEHQLESILRDFTEMQAKSNLNDLSNLPKGDRQALVTRAVAAIHQITGEGSPYSKEIERVFMGLPSLHEHLTSIMGVVKGLLADLKAGFLKTLVEVVHGDMFSDFLEMAQHLCESNYKDAAAVVAGSTLESHLRELCRKMGIAVETPKGGGGVVHKKADTMNSELASAKVYSKLDQKSVTAWLDLRNKSAHGEYGSYSREQVALLISGVRDFMARNPA
jgi:hypothetical protein